MGYTPLGFGRSCFEKLVGWRNGYAVQRATLHRFDPCPDYNFYNRAFGTQCPTGGEAPRNDARPGKSNEAPSGSLVVEQLPENGSKPLVRFQAARKIDHKRIGE